ncbi:Upstream activation factor subunit spp27 [Galdieria sulphuraria]|uniref:DM2 domain-containing protein n=1 Tax=Galdieria sulphuraria TaxID=130081 RepID=M2X7W6_GALSU|nr:uncharacterized protein Gasu_00170 [Galdieria sulphuraria]EME32645.1 hypothetical protein Gasu_00170 [Galdieria sulphuraria]GJD10074.1 Upstream activation factor subunit spp27 [Galdieria sulphuraria]|eukprot:XP_005709165.1 hypothetical protein Gasu_00170 [Galdieria sulphuraria]
MSSVQQTVQDTIRTRLPILLQTHDWETMTIRKLTQLLLTEVEKSEVELLPLVRQIVVQLLKDANPSVIPLDRVKGFFTGLRKPLKVDKRLQEILQCGSILPRTQIVKYLNQYIKKHNLQDPEQKNKIVLDNALRSLFGVETATFFSLNKLISPFLTIPEEQEQEMVHQYMKEHLKEALLAAEESKMKRKQQSKVQSLNKGTTSHRGESLQKPLKLSNLLSQICGAEYLSRSQVVKKVWEYIKLHNLQKASDKRNISCDALLKQLFDGKEEINSFHISKYLSPHLQKLNGDD